MTKVWIKGCVAALVLAGAACGPLQEGNRGVALVSSIAQTAIGGNEPPASGSTEPAFDRAFIEAQGADLLLVSIIDRGATAIASLTATNGDKTTWFSPDQVSLTLKDGLLIGTRGLGDDLMGADVSGAMASLTAGGNHLRTLEFLNGLDQIEQISYRCETVRADTETLTIFEKSYQTTVFEETCVGENETFKNTYWRDDKGVTRQARQWISPMAGYLGYQKL